MDWDAIWDLRDAARGEAEEGEQEERKCCDNPVTREDVRENNVTCISCGMVVDSNNIVSLSTWRPGTEMARRSIYKRRHHFNERLVQLMCQDRVVPPKLLERAKREIMPPYSKTKIRVFLRKERMQRYIENWIQVYCYLQNIPPPGKVLNCHEVLWLNDTFLQVESSFLKVKPATRSSMLNYNFIFVRLLQMLGHKSLLQWFPQLKSRAKTRVLDKIWHDITVHMDLPYHPLPTVKSLR
jgi:hypothetical protein